MKKADGTWELSYLYNLSNGDTNVGYIIDNIQDDQVKPGNIIHIDTTRRELIVPFIIASRYM